LHNHIAICVKPIDSIAGLIMLNIYFRTKISHMYRQRPYISGWWLVVRNADLTENDIAYYWGWL